MIQFWLVYRWTCHGCVINFLNSSKISILNLKKKSIVKFNFKNDQYFKHWTYVEAK